MRDPTRDLRRPVVRVADSRGFCYTRVFPRCRDARAIPASVWPRAWLRELLALATSSLPQAPSSLARQLRRLTRALGGPRARVSLTRSKVRRLLARRAVATVRRDLEPRARGAALDRVGSDVDLRS